MKYMIIVFWFVVFNNENKKLAFRNFDKTKYNDHNSTLAN